MATKLGKILLLNNDDFYLKNGKQNIKYYKIGIFHSDYEEMKDRFLSDYSLKAFSSNLGKLIIQDLEDVFMIRDSDVINIHNDITYSKEDFLNIINNVGDKLDLIEYMEIVCDLFKEDGKSI
jgi:hypothetical protein